MPLKSYRIFLAGVLAAVCVAAAAAVFFYVSPQQEADTVEADRFAYYLKAYDGKVGAFYSGESAPFYTLTVPLNVLPEVDQQELREGIFVEDEARLRQIIEDFEG